MAHNQMRGGEKKEVHLGPPAAHTASLTPVSSRASRPAPSLYSTRSYVDAHGTYFSEPEQDDVPEGEKDVEIQGDGGKAFEVGWDGPDDPMNPKNMKKTKKWLVVMTLAFGSLCVTCTSSLYTTTYGESV